MELMMQLLNPDFSKVVKVYHDPFAKETAFIGVAGVTVAGGNDKSYFVKVSSDPAAYKLTKKDYKKEFTGMWSKCKDMSSKHPDVKWSDLVQHILDYSACGM